MFLKRKRKEENSSKKKKKEYILTEIPFYISSSIDNSNVKVIDPLYNDKASITLIYNLTEKKDFKIYGEKDTKNCYNLDNHIHNAAKFLVQNELYFGCRIEVSKGVLLNVLPFKNLEFVYFKTINLYDNIPVYILFRRYLLDDNCKIIPKSKVFICKLGDTICDFPINNYKKFEFLNENDFENISMKNVLDLLNSKYFKAHFYFSFDSKENIINKNVFYLNKLPKLKKEFDELYILYNYNLSVKNIFITFIEMEKFILTHLPIYFYINKLTNFPFQNFFQGFSLFKAIDYLKLKECFKQNYRIKHPVTKKKQSTKDYLEVFLLNNKYNPENYRGYLNNKDLITTQGYVVNKTIFEIDIFSAYGSSFLNIYEKEKLVEFKVLYDVIKKLLNLRRSSPFDEIITKVCKILVNAGCYGSLNDISSRVFPLYPELMIKIIQNNQSVMKLAIKFLVDLGYRRIYSKLDSHFLIFKDNKKSIKQFECDLLSLNKYLSTGFPNSEFKFKGKHSNGVWFNQNNYVLHNNGEFIIKGRLKSKKYPKTIREFCKKVCKKLFKSNEKLDFKSEYENFLKWN